MLKLSVRIQRHSFREQFVFKMFSVLIINNTIYLYSASCASEHKVTKRVQRVMDLFKQFSLLRVMNLMFQCELRENKNKIESFFSLGAQGVSLVM